MQLIRRIVCSRESLFRSQQIQIAFRIFISPNMKIQKYRSVTRVRQVRRQWSRQWRRNSLKRWRRLGGTQGDSTFSKGGLIYSYAITHICSSVRSFDCCCSFFYFIFFCSLFFVFSFVRSFVRSFVWLLLFFFSRNPTKYFIFFCSLFLLLLFFCSFAFIYVLLFIFSFFKPVPKRGAGSATWDMLAWSWKELLNMWWERTDWLERPGRRRLTCQSAFVEGWFKFLWHYAWGGWSCRI